MLRITVARHRSPAPGHDVLIQSDDDRRWVMVEALSGGVLAAAVFLLVQTARRAALWHGGALRGVAILASGALLGAVAAAGAPGGLILVDGVAFVVAVRAAVLARTRIPPLRSIVGQDRPQDAGDPPWWPAFEREFRRYSRKHPATGGRRDG